MKRNKGYIYTLPLAFWITLFFVIPLIIICAMSFMKRGVRGGVLWEFSLDAYRALFSQPLPTDFFGVTIDIPAFIKVAGTTVYISTVATVITLAIAIPSAYFIARSRYKNFFLLLVIVPFWTNLLVRIFAWISVLGNNGFVNKFLMTFGVIADPVQFLYSTGAVITVTIYTSLPYAILPLYSAIEKFDFTLLEAARDLGASKPQAMRKIFLPNIKPGVFTALLFTFIPALGSYAVPELVGGSGSYMIGNMIASELTKSRNWPLAASMSLILTVITTIGILILVRIDRSHHHRHDKLAVSEPTNE
jgi:spermidine/putrescine transport system permease protein